MPLPMSTIATFRRRAVMAVAGHGAVTKLHRPPPGATTLPDRLPVCFAPRQRQQHLTVNAVKTAVASSGVLTTRRNFSSSGPVAAKGSPWVLVNKQRKEIAALLANNKQLFQKLEVVMAEVATLKEENTTLKEKIDIVLNDNATLRAENAQLRRDFATVVDRVHHPISCAIATKYWWKYFVLPVIEPDAAKLQALQSGATAAYPSYTSPRYFQKKVPDWPSAAARAGMSITDLHDRIQKLDHSRIRRNVVAHEVTADDIRVAIKYARDPIEESMMRWSFENYWGVTPEAYDVLEDAVKQQLLHQRMCNCEYRSRLQWWGANDGDSVRRADGVPASHSQTGHDLEMRVLFLQNERFAVGTPGCQCGGSAVDPVQRRGKRPQGQTILVGEIVAVADVLG
ncbi:hypothetical protein FN846DRAFT_891521 [Sphaerosporella brunnea]|uniref:Uncharacterized protein n=1 Tax=Sphaerosporella brunnea TaxID=1250544 RepID=A0A5J5ET66_9PEZI|nr:hypothetical protein FN846DRAFT_891521 [Sphaerosporella brunnea]